MPFDAMKGLQEALRDREERHSRVERHGISEEEQEALSNVLNRLSKGTRYESVITAISTMWKNPAP